VKHFNQIEYACLTDVGVRRSHNQDNHAVQLAGDDEQWRLRGHLFLVADGMGAHAVGEKASEQAVGVIPHTYQKHAPQGPVSALRRAFVEANASIHACGQQNREFEGMGTTSTALLLRPEGAWVGHVGDSRAYRIRGEVIEQLSYDHSLLWEYARLQQIDPDEVEDIPSNVIHRCLGPEPEVQPDIEGPHPIQPGDVYLLCSDGLSGQVTNQEIGAVAGTLEPAEACRFLIDLANLRGGPDNITVIIVRVTDGQSKDGQAGPTRSAAGGRRLRPPWWVALLLSGTLLAAGAGWMQSARVPGAEFVFLLAALAIPAGLVGLVLRYWEERNRLLVDGEDLPPPRAYRHASCRIERPLVEQVGQALATLRQRAGEKHWEPDWDRYERHRAAAEELLGKNDLPGAFREYCRAIIPLTQSLRRQDLKEEAAQPIWSKK
jgi:protein phosphatase